MPTERDIQRFGDPVRSKATLKFMISFFFHPVLPAFRIPVSATNPDESASSNRKRKLRNNVPCTPANKAQLTH